MTVDTRQARRPMRRAENRILAVEGELDGVPAG